MSDVAIIMGSKSDWPIMEKAYKTLVDLEISCTKEVVSAHRTPERMVEFAKQARQNGFKVIIAGAGGAAHLPGMVASLTTLPVIGVPISLNKLDGMDSLLSIVQMPKGIPVATVAIDNAINAALLAARMLSLENSQVETRLNELQQSQIETVARMNQDLGK
ncbi:MAG: 5-(carboxyamino)imidazole ribonucleotide mutase [Bdellovibrionales bacterium]|nr:5-(carboxyamino)imidazole ribonucleotide mutase [Bdellovibrionales bacterium]